MADILVVDSISEIHQSLGLPKPKHPLLSVFYHRDGILPESYDGVRLQLNLYQIMFKSGHEGSFGYGRNTYDFKEGSIIFTRPGQVITLESHDDGMVPRGWSLLFHPDLIRKSSLGRTIEEYNFFDYEVTEALHVSDLEKTSLEELVHKIELEYQQHIDRHSQKLIVSNIELLLDYCTRYYDRQFFTRTNLHQDLVSDFNALLRDYYRSDMLTKVGMPTVKYCGEAMNMSPNYLSDLLKKETGKSAQEHIHHFVVDRAKTLLLGSTEAISHIAYDLGFEYSQHFSRLFKAKTGMSPGAYRRLN